MNIDDLKRLDRHDFEIVAKVAKIAVIIGEAELIRGYPLKADVAINRAIAMLELTYEKLIREDHATNTARDPKWSSRDLKW